MVDWNLGWKIAISIARTQGAEVRRRQECTLLSVCRSGQPFAEQGVPAKFRTWAADTRCLPGIRVLAFFGGPGFLAVELVKDEIPAVCQSDGAYIHSSSYAPYSDPLFRRKRW